MPPRNPYRDPRWLELRQKVFQRDNSKCQLCGTFSGRLIVHHRTYANGYHPRRPWITPQKDLVTLCNNCHETLEAIIRKLRSKPEALTPELLAKLVIWLRP